MFRSSVIGFDETLCAIQGYAGAYALNVNKPINGAICFAGIAFIEKLVYKISKDVIPGPTIVLGPFPLGPKHLVSYGLATYTTVKVMQLAGLILIVPKIITIVGLTCITALALGIIKVLAQPSLKPLDEQVRDHLNSRVFANRVFTIPHPNETSHKTYEIRFICNPEEKKVTFEAGNGKMSSSCRYIFASNDSIPEIILNKYNFIQYSTYTTEINGVQPLSYTANPSLEK